MIEVFKTEAGYENSNGENVNLNGVLFIEGSRYLLFKDDFELQTYMRNLPVVWSKQEYCDELNEAHTQLFRSLYTGRGYMSYAEVESWARTTRTDARSLAWKAEAQSIIDWFQSTCIALYDYMDNVTEETSQPIETFINSLPKFDN